MRIVGFSGGILLVNYYKIVTITMKLKSCYTVYQCSVRIYGNELSGLFTCVWYSIHYSTVGRCERPVQTLSIGYVNALYNMRMYYD
jgi:hypothetical protein